ncbi:MAG: hypothetical protein Q9183_007625 [Haloplaca sp. 2 TL-2023]
MRLLNTLLSLLAIISAAFAAGIHTSDVRGFELIERWPVKGCYLHVVNVCGCSTKIQAGATASCNELHPGIFKWQICGGHLELNTKVSLYPVSFKKKGCNDQYCHLSDLHNAEQLKGKYNGAWCEPVTREKPLGIGH